MVHLGLSNSRMKDFTDLAIAGRRTAFDGSTLVAAIRATFRRRGTQLPEGEIVAMSEQFVQDERAQANWKAYIKREGLREFTSLAQLVEELREFLSRPIEYARTGEPFTARRAPGGPWK
jgi:DNA-binding response OmpR family regulator